MRFFAPLLITACLLAGCPAPGAAPPAATTVATTPPPVASAPYAGPLPDYVKSPEIQVLYRWAAPNRAILQYFPCTCGCETEGHRSNWNCYVKAEKPGGTYEWDPMSVG